MCPWTQSELIMYKSLLSVIQYIGYVHQILCLILCMTFRLLKIKSKIGLKIFFVEYFCIKVSLGVLGPEYASMSPASLRLSVLEISYFV